jgi:hypothetical protein
MGLYWLPGMFPELTLSIFVVSRVGILFKVVDENRGCSNFGRSEVSLIVL